LNAFGNNINYTRQEFESVFLGMSGSVCMIIYCRGEPVFVTEHLKERFGFESYDMREIHQRLFSQDGGRNIFRDHMEAAIRGKAETRYYTLCRNDGVAVRTSVEITPLGKLEGKPLVGCLITERPPVEFMQDILLDEKDLFRLIAEESINGIALVNDRLEIVYANPALLKIYGYDSFEEFKAVPLVNHFAPESLHTVIERAQNWREGRRNPPRFSYKIITKQGEVRVLDVLASDFYAGGEHYHLNSVLDVTEMERAQKELRESEERYRLHFENVQEIIFSIDPQLRIVDISPSVEPLLGYRPEEIVGRAFSELKVAPPGLVENIYYTARRAFDGEAVNEAEYELLARDGSRKVGSVSAKPFYVDGKVVQVFCVARDVTERKQAEAALRESEEKYRSLFEDSRDGVFIISREGVVLDVNRAASEMVGYEVEELVNLRIEDLLEDPAEADRFRAAIDSAGGVRDHETRLKKKDGTVIDCLFSASVKRSRFGRVLAYQGIVRDVTEQKAALRALRQSEERYKLLVEKSPDAIAIYSDGRIRYMNPACRRLMKFPERADELIGKPVMQFVHPDFHQDVKKRIEKVSKGEADYGFFEETLIRFDGSLMKVEVAIAPIEFEGKPALQAVVRDISDRKRAEAALRESEARFRHLAESTDDVIWTMNMDLENTYVNCAIERFRGYTPEEHMGQKLSDILVPHSFDHVVGVLKKELELEARGEIDDPYKSRVMELEYRKKDGSTVWAELRSTFMRDRHGNIIGVRGVTRELSDRRKAVKDLAQQESLLRAAMNNLGQAVIIMGPDQKVRFANRAAEELFHKENGSLAGIEVKNLIHSGDRRKWRCMTQKLLDGESEQNISLRLANGKESKEAPVTARRLGPASDDVLILIHPE